MPTNHLVEDPGLRLSQLKERPAKEALAAVLQQSSVARQTLVRMVSQAVAALPDDLSFQIRAGGPAGGRPEIFGIDSQGQERLLVQTKFWAGLTPHQPRTELDRFHSAEDCVLLLIVPERRVHTLWPELLRVWSETGGQAQERPTLPFWRKAQLGDNRFLAMASWTVVLATFAAATDQSAAAGVRQLAALCQRLDAEEFLPFFGAHVRQTPRILIQLNRLVDDVVTLAGEAGVADAQGLPQNSSVTGYGRFLRLGQRVCASLRIDYQDWAAKGQSPLWLVLYGTDWDGENLSRCVACLDKWKTAIPPRLFVEDNRVRLPIVLPEGGAEERVLNAVLGELTEIAERLKSLPPSTHQAAAPPPNEE